MGERIGSSESTDLFAPPRIERKNLEDGGFVLRSSQPLKNLPQSLSVFLEHWATEAQDRFFLMERELDGRWTGVSFGEAHAKVIALATYLLNRGLGPEKPLLILSGNSVRHGLLMLAAMHVGIPVIPVSPAYSLLSEDLAKLRHIIGLTSPGLAYANKGSDFYRAIELLASQDIPVLTDDTMPEEADTDPRKVAQAHSNVTHDTVAKILFTSGSTGMPKGVINTQRMMLANQQALAQVWPFLERRPPVILDWLPWNHTFGGNFNFNQILRNGGTLYIDDGKPAPGAIDQSIRNLREISPTLYFNVPRGFDMLLPVLRDDRALREAFFAKLDLIFFSGAALPDHLRQGLDELSLRTRGEKIPFVSAWGATETAPMITCVHFPVDRADIIGLPTPGYDLKFLPVDNKLEMRVRGPHVTPGYWNDKDQTAKAFDDDGYYRIGDAGRLVSAENPAHGILFDGRLSENFKLLTGTWVAVGNVRLQLLDALKPIASDAVIAGHDREEVGALVFLNAEQCRALTSRDDDLSGYSEDPVVRDYIAERLKKFNASQTGSASRVRRVLLMPDTPSVERNEVTDKGYINQRLSLELRARAVENLFGDSPAVVRPQKVNA